MGETVKMVLKDAEVLWVHGVKKGKKAIEEWKVKLEKRGTVVKKVPKGLRVLKERKETKENRD